MSALLTGSDEDVIQRKVEMKLIEERSKEFLFEEFYEIERTIAWIKANEITLLALQFPDELLADSVRVSRTLESQIPNLDVFLLADTTYAPCCVDEVAAEHADIRHIVHYGRACLSRPAKSSVLYVFGKSPGQSGCLLSLANLLSQKLENSAQTIWILYDFSYVHLMKDLRHVCKDFENVFIPHTSNDDIVQDEYRRCCGYLLPNDSPNEIIYIGSESPHLFNVFMNFPNSTPCLFDPKSPEQFRPLNLRIQRKLARRYYLVEKTRDAEIVGIVVATMAVERYLDVVEHLKELLTANGKRYYVISVGKPNEAKLGNFPDIGIFVLVACPLTSMYDSLNQIRDVVTPFDVELALNPSCEWTGEYTTEFSDVLELEMGSLEEEEEVRVSMVDGKVRTRQMTSGKPSENEMMLVPLESGPLMELRQTKEFWGLKADIGLTPIATIEEGLTGIASNYHEGET